MRHRWSDEVNDIWYSGKILDFEDMTYKITYWHENQTDYTEEGTEFYDISLAELLEDVKSANLEIIN